MNVDARDFGYVRELVLERSGIALSESKQYLVESRLGTLARTLGIESIGELVRAVRDRGDRKLQSALVEAMTTNETSFLRDIHPFALLRTKILPELLETLRERRQLDIWCGAASSGQEPYTIAMTLHEHFPQLRHWRVNFLATDISEKMLAKAREGLYTQLEVNRGLPAPLLVKYFEQRGELWQLKPVIREAVDFQPMNLIAPWPSLPKMDLIFLRNVLIYFDTETKRRIFDRLCALMQPHTVLFLGAAETTISVDTPLERVSEQGASYYRLKRDA